MLTLEMPTPAALPGEKGCTMPKKKKTALCVFLYDEDAKNIQTIRKRMLGLSEKNYLSAVGRQAIIETAGSSKRPNKETRDRVETGGGEHDRRFVVTFRFDETLRDLLAGVVSRCEFKSDAAAIRFCLASAAAEKKGGAS